MSRRKRRSDNLAPALFPFLAVLLCTIGALVLLLAITVTNSHASAKREAEVALLAAKDQRNLAQAFSEELENQREELKKKIENRRRELQDIEDHIQRLNSELESLVANLKNFQNKNETIDQGIDSKTERLKALETEIDEKKKKIAEEIEKKKKTKPAFAIIPYSGRNGTNRRPIYIECNRDGVVLQPEGIALTHRDLIPTGPGNPLATALRMLRNAYSEHDSKIGITQPPYPLLLVRPDGIEAYALATRSMSGWDDQFGYELIDDKMDLAFPSGIPGLKESLQQVVANAKQRQQALLAANPTLAKKYEFSDDEWNESPSSSNLGTNPSNTRSRPGEGLKEGNEWSMVQPMEGGADESPYTIPKVYSNGTPDSQARFSGETPLQNAMAGTPQQFQSAPPGYPIVAAQSPLNGESASAGINHSPPTNAEQSFSGGNLGNNQSSFGQAGIPQATNSLAGIAQTGNGQTGVGQGSGQEGSEQGAATSSSSGTASSFSNAAPSQSNPSSAGGIGSSSLTGQSSNASTDPNDPQNQNGTPNISMNLGSKDQPRYVKPEGDLKPISVEAGQDWAQTKSQNKATPMRRTIQIVAIKNKWFIRSQDNAREFQVVILLDNGAKQCSKELASAIQQRVQSWDTAVLGGYWVPVVEIQAASDAQQSVAMLERLLEGSGVELQKVPLTIPR
ncbi:MAG: hypothetical protein LW870_05200 [Pirellula sp.]|jgi:hypothetical protein|nr:hypothetical protein [Pirellula sp.]